MTGKTLGDKQRQHVPQHGQNPLKQLKETEKL
jgi:hypothetical protein